MNANNLNKLSTTKLMVVVLTFLSATLVTNYCWAQKGGKGGGGGGSTPSYALVDLQGLPGWALQSSGQFLTNRDSNTGSILIAGNSHWYLDRAAPARLLPVLWHIDALGNPGPNDPFNLGLPSSVAEIEVRGMNRYGVIVSITRIAAEMDGDEYIFPSFVDVPGLPYQEVPVPQGASRNTWVDGINDNGQIIGIYEVHDPIDAAVFVVYTAMWQLESDGTISGPVNLDDWSDGHAFRPIEINSFGVIAGEFHGYPAIAKFQGGSLQNVLLNSSPQFMGANVEALNDYDINDARLIVVGSSSGRGYAWRPNDVASPNTIFGTFAGRFGASEALDVNNGGQIVGWADTKNDGQQAFIYTDGVMKNLNSMVDVGTKTLNRANSINDNGDITGFMRIPPPVSESHGFLLRPFR